MQHNGTCIEIEEEVQRHHYHFVQEGVARDEWRTAYINTDDNVADLLEKPLSGLKRAKFVRMILHHVFPEGSGDTGGD